MLYIFLSIKNMQIYAISMSVTDIYSKLKMLFVMLKCLKTAIRLNMVLDLSLFEIIDSKDR